MSEQERAGLTLKSQSTSARPCTKLEAGKYDTLLEVAKRRMLMVWTCGDGDIGTLANTIWQGNFEVERSRGRQQESGWTM